MSNFDVQEDNLSKKGQALVSSGGFLCFVFCKKTPSFISVS